MLISKTIDDALVLIGVKNPTEEAMPQDHEYGLRTLNRIIDGYNINNLMVTYLQDISYSEPENGWKSSVTIGLGEEIDSIAPIGIQGLFWSESDTDYSSKSMSHNEWSSISYKESQGIPKYHYFQKAEGNAIKIMFDEVPQNGLELHLIAKVPYTGKNSDGRNFLATDDISWSAGFEKALMYRLAVELCPSYDVEPSQIIIAVADESERDLKTSNYQPSTQKKGFVGTGRRKFVSNRARY